MAGANMMNAVSIGQICSGKFKFGAVISMAPVEFDQPDFYHDCAPSSLSPNGKSGTSIAEPATEPDFQPGRSKGSRWMVDANDGRRLDTASSY